MKPTPTKLFDSANGATLSVPRFGPWRRRVVLQSDMSPMNEWIMEQLIMVDALKPASAMRITVVTLFFGYVWQEKKNRGREPISAWLMTDLFDRRGGLRRVRRVDHARIDGQIEQLAGPLTTARTAPPPAVPVTSLSASAC